MQICVGCKLCNCTSTSTIIQILISELHQEILIKIMTTYRRQKCEKTTRSKVNLNIKSKSQGVIMKKEPKFCGEHLYTKF
jgi:hypothetical protein